jgi:hypothetical protein
MQNRRKFKLYEIPQSLVQGNKFLKWTEVLFFFYLKEYKNY